MTRRDLAFRGRWLTGRLPAELNGGSKSVSDGGAVDQSQKSTIGGNGGG